MRMSVSPFPRKSTLGKVTLAIAATGLLATVAGCSSDASTAESSAPSASASAYPLTITNCGRDITVDKAPTRAITMNQGATEVMLGLDLQGSMVGTAYLDDSVAKKWQTAYDKVPVLAVEYPNQEAVLAAKPDFVYASYSSAFDKEAAGSQESLQTLGIASYVSPFGCDDKTLRPEASFDAVFDEIKDIGQIFNVPANAESLIDEQQSEVDAASDTNAGEGLNVFWFDSGDKTPYVGAGGGAPQLILDSVGATNIFADVAGGWADGNWEQVLKADPDVIVLADASWSTAAEKQKYLESDPALKDLTAVKSKAYVVLPFSETTAGVRTADGVKSLSEQLTALNK